MPDTDRVVMIIQSGDAALREDFIEKHRLFIQRYASFVCSRRLDWSQDELSIALIAFNRALDRYVSDSNHSFLGFARTVIRNGLIDHFRTRAPATISLETEDRGAAVEWSVSLKYHQVDLEREDRAYEVSRLRQLLGQFGLTLSDLVQASPVHHDTREQLKSAAWTAGQNPAIAARLLETGRLPLKEIQAATGLSRKVLDRWRRYLLSLIIIATDVELEGLADYIWGRRQTPDDPDQGPGSGNPA